MRWFGVRTTASRGRNAQGGRGDRVASKWGGLTALLAGFFVLLLDTTIVAVASPSIQADLGGDVAGLFWVTAGYLLAFSVPLLVAGRLHLVD